MKLKKIKQKTLKKAIEISGKGLFTGEDVSIRLCPSFEKKGVFFIRKDLSQKNEIPARLEYVKDTTRRVTLGDGKEKIQTVEHLLSALCAFQVDQLSIEVFGPEIPICDGSAKYFAEMIEQVGVQELEEEKEIYRLASSVFWTEGNVSFIAIPSEEYKVTYAMHFPQSKLLQAQCYTYVVQDSSYAKEIAPARTFALYEEIEPFLKQNKVQGGSLDNTVIIKGDTVMNPEGVRFREEMVRHKILDLIGDLSLMGVTFKAHIIAIRSGHSSNVLFAKNFFHNLVKEDTI